MVPMVASLIAPTASLSIQTVASSLINVISGKRQNRENSGFLSLLALPLIMKILGKRVKRAGKGYNNMNHMDKIF